jgi:hypothetical protein
MLSKKENLLLRPPLGKEYVVGKKKRESEKEIDDEIDGTHGY